MSSDDDDAGLPWPTVDLSGFGGKERRRAAGREAQSSGGNFEQWLERHHEEALRLGIVAGPIEHNEPHAKMIHGQWVLVKSGVSDFTGVLYNGYASHLGIEAKKRDRRLKRSEVEPKQAEYLDAIVRGSGRGGGLAFLLVRFVEGGVREFCVPWQFVPWRVAKSAESISAEDLLPWLIQPGCTCYLAPYCPVRGKPVAIKRRVFARE